MQNSFAFTRMRALAVALLAVLFTSVQPPAAESADAFQSFEAWLARYRSAQIAQGKAASAASPMAVEGAALARARRSELLRLARTDPRQALARALRPPVLKGLPSAVQQESEHYLDACSSTFSLDVSDEFVGDTPRTSRLSRSLTVGGRTYEAIVFGRRVGTPSKEIHANGVVIDGLVVLFETPLRRMDAEEAALDETVRARCGAPGPSCIGVRVGAQTLVFASEAALRRHEAALEKDESTLGRRHPAGRTEALDPITQTSTHEGPTIASAWTTGPKTVLYIRVDMSDRPGDPVAAEAVQSTMDGSVDPHYRASSYNKTSLKTTVIPTVRLPRTAAEYDSIGDGQLMTDAIAAARAAGWDIANFNLYIVAFPRLSYGYSGKASVGRARVWLNGSFGSGVTAHELGHNYGVFHANLWQTNDGTVIGSGSNVEYGNRFDVMGRGGISGHFNAWFKTRLDWVLPAEYTNVTASGAFRIGAIDDPAATEPRALRIVKDTTRNYWVEFRRAYTSNRWAVNGAMLNWGYNSNTGSHLLDMTPGSADGATDAPLLVGRTFSDTAAGLHITPVLRTASPLAMEVVVKRGTFPDNTAPAAAVSADPSTAPRNALVMLKVDATDANGDALAYGWVFDDGTFAPNAATVQKSWSTAGTKLVRCIVSDMVGGTTTVETSVVVTTSTPTPTPRVRVTPTPTSTPTPTPVVVTPTPTSTPTPTPTSTPGNVVFSANFDVGQDGFTYADDTFRGTTQPGYASGARITSGGFSGGALRVRLGGVDDGDILGMSGGWRRSFTLAAPAALTLTLRLNVTQAANYESDEMSDGLLAVDGVLVGTGGTDRLSRVVGDGNGGVARSTGFQLHQLDLGTLAAGTHVLTFGGHNNKKTLADESTDVVLDEVVLSTR